MARTPVPVDGGPFEFEGGRGFLHVLPEMLLEGVRLALEEEDDLLHHFSVVFAVDFSHTWTEASATGMIDARPLPPGKMPGLA